MNQTNMPFQRASDRVRTRWTFAHWLQLLGRTAPIIFVISAATLIALRLQGYHWNDHAVAVALVVLWSAALGLCAHLRRPSRIHALAWWDAETERNDMFVSAYCFETDGANDDGEQLHVENAKAALPGALETLKKDLPAPLLHRAWILPIVFLALAMSGALVVPIPPEDQPLSEDALALAEKLAQELKDKNDQFKESDGLSKKEKEEIEKLKEAIDDTTENLKKLSTETPREVLEELERQAREAEKLAKELEGKSVKELTSKMIAELERHADTTDLAAGLRANNFEKIAKEADKIADKLQNEPTIEQTDRFENALDKSLKAASEGDKKTVTGKHLTEADKELQKKDAFKAGEKFADLARHFKKVAQRKKRRRQLEQLAKELRKAGRKIMGNKSSGVRRLAQKQSLQSPNSGLQALAQLKPGQLNNSSLLNSSSMQLKLAQARMSNQKSGNTKMNFVPIPGQGPIPGANVTLMPMSGQIPPGANLTLIPGGGQSPIPGSGMMPIPGAGAGQQPGNGGGIGGQRAGTGTAAYNKQKTVPFKASSTHVANQQFGADGESSVRSTEGQPHTENAREERKQAAMDFIKAEEDALDEEPLPLTRREQVLRYFTELRKQLEH
ncbi:MAG: hypothetical protein QGG53_40505 [Planctomycetota bacterium]|jgi:hypothetical protein|nr:hypothetical protein [Planctomycetota bacterium]